MKLARIGAAGQERPAALDADGTWRDLSEVVPDITGALLAALGGLAGADWLPHLLHAGGPWPWAAVVSVLFALGCAALLAWNVFSVWVEALRNARCALVGRVVIAGLGGMILLDAVIATAAHPLGGLMCAAFYPVFIVMGRIIRMG